MLTMNQYKSRLIISLSWFFPIAPACAASLREGLSLGPLIASYGAAWHLGIAVWRTVGAGAIPAWWLRPGYALFAGFNAIGVLHAVGGLWGIATGVAALGLLNIRADTNKNRLNDATAEWTGSTIRSHSLALVAGVLILGAPLLIGTTALEAQRVLPFEVTMIDTWFFDSMTASIAKGGLTDSLWQEGSSHCYQWGAFLTPAALVKLFELSPHQATWGVWTPFLLIFTPAAIAEALCRWRFHAQQGNSTDPGRWLLVLVIYLAWKMPNPNAIVAHEWADIYWKGFIGWIPMRAPELQAVALVAVAALLIRTGALSGHRNGVLPMLLFLAVPLAKVAFAPAVGLMLTAAAIDARDKIIQRQLICSASAVIVGVILVSVTIMGDASSGVRDWSPGYLAEEIGSRMGLGKGALGTVGAVLFILIVVTWRALATYSVGIRLGRRGFAKIALMSLVTVTPAAVFRLREVAPGGGAYRQYDGDLLQFVGGLIILLPLGISWSGVDYRHPRKILVRGMVGLCLLIYASFLLAQWSSVREPIATTEQRQERRLRASWARDVSVEYAEEVDGERHSLFTVGTKPYPGQLLTAHGVGPFWYSGHPGQGNGIYPARIENNRFAAAREWEEGRHWQALQRMQSAGVTHVVINPADQQALLAQAEAGDWFICNGYIFAVNDLVTWVSNR